jgi:hypothetical protein
MDQDHGYWDPLSHEHEPVAADQVENGFTRFRRAAQTPFNLVYEVQV